MKFEASLAASESKVRDSCYFRPSNASHLQYYGVLLRLLTPQSVAPRPENDAGRDPPDQRYSHLPSSYRHAIESPERQDH